MNPDSLTRSVEGKFSGTREAVLRQNDLTQTAEQNSLNRSREVAYLSGISKLKSEGKYKASDYNKAMETINGIDISSITNTDNNNVKKAANYLIGLDMHPTAVAIAIQGSIEEDFLDDTMPAVNSDEWEAMVASATSMTERMTGNTKDNKDVLAALEKRKKYVPRKAGTIGEIQARNLQFIPREVLRTFQDYRNISTPDIVPVDRTGLTPPKDVIEEPAVQPRTSYIPENINAALSRPYDPNKGSSRLGELPKKWNEYASKSNKNFSSVGSNESLAERGLVNIPDKFTEKERDVASNIKAGLERGMKPEDFTEYEQEILARMRGTSRAMRIGAEALTSSPNTFPDRVVLESAPVDSDLIPRGSRSLLLNAINKKDHKAFREYVESE
jgi:hypothetical protein